MEAAPLIRALRIYIRTERDQLMESYNNGLPNETYWKTVGKVAQLAALTKWLDETVDTLTTDGESDD